MDDAFNLTVTVPAEEWARLNMRVRYLEAAVVQAYRYERQLREWFSVSDLLGLELPTLPTSRQGLLRKAHMERWLSRTVDGHGGSRFEFHFSALPRHAFAELLRRIITPPDDAPPVLRPERSAFPANAEPPWVLPLMRLLRQDAGMNSYDACRHLSASLPPTVAPPTREEVETAIQRLRQGGV